MKYLSNRASFEIAFLASVSSAQVNIPPPPKKKLPYYARCFGIPIMCTRHTPQTLLSEVHNVLTCRANVSPSYKTGTVLL